jgi:transposase
MNISKTNLKNLRSELDAQIADTLRCNDRLSYDEAAIMFGVSRSWITSVAKRFNIHRTVGRKPQAVK